ncbi:MAG: hypothetical protein GX617_11255 [Lentisphaerae bacterium]|nr:hypothetical protein [Lentisphaerota bacterium]
MGTTRMTAVLIAAMGCVALRSLAADAPVAAAVAAAADGLRQPAALDTTYTRVQSGVAPELAYVGTIIPKNVHEMSTSRWSLGCECLDRQLADWEGYREYLPWLGIKRIRLQGGWFRSEREEGVYDFGWLDRIVDDAQAMGLEVCMETSYLNPIYGRPAGTGPGGSLPKSDAMLAGWKRWVDAMARHYSAKGVREWMMFNEPNLRSGGNSWDEIVENNILTAEIIRAVNPEARIGAFVLAGVNRVNIMRMLEQIKAQGKERLFDWAVYHGYSGNPDRINGEVQQLVEQLREVAPHIRAWQGESGCASEAVQYALSGMDWTEYSQAKWNARRMISDIGCDSDSLVFTISDLSYNKNFISRYGLLKTRPDNSLIKVKMAFYTVQHVVSIFNDDLELAAGRMVSFTTPHERQQVTSFVFKDRRSGQDVVAFWDGSEVPDDRIALDEVVLTLPGGQISKPVWVDIVTGHVYAIDASQIRHEGEALIISGLPMYDAPGVVIDEGLLRVEVPPKVKLGGNRRSQRGRVPYMSYLEPYMLPGTQQPAPALILAGVSGITNVSPMIDVLQQHGVHVFLLRFTQQTDAASMGKDIRAVVEHLRANAAKWQIVPDAIGLLAAANCPAPMALLAEQGNAALGINFVVIQGERTALPETRAVEHQIPMQNWQDALREALEGYKKDVF